MEPETEPESFISHQIRSRSRSRSQNQSGVELGLIVDWVGLVAGAGVAQWPRMSRSVEAESGLAVTASVLSAWPRLLAGLGIVMLIFSKSTGN